MSNETKQPVTVEQAVEHLSRIASRTRRELTLGVPFDPGFMTVGPKPVKRVLSIYPGIDWDRGTVFLDVGERLCAPAADTEHLKRHFALAQHAIGMIGVALGSSLTPEGKLKAIKEHFDRYARNPAAPVRENT